MERFETVDNILCRYNGKTPRAVVPEGIEIVAEGAFEGNEELESVVLRKEVKEVRRGAFRNCRKLREIMMLGEDVSFGSEVFKGCVELADENGFVIYGGYLYDYIGKNEIVRISEEVNFISRSAFQYNETIRKIIFPKKETTIEPMSFQGCAGLADKDGFIIVNNVLYGYVGKEYNIAVPQGVTEISMKCFASGVVESVSVPDSVASVGAMAFMDCCEIKEITLPASVRSIGKYLFAGCKKLEKATIDAIVPALTDGMFAGCEALREIRLFRSVKVIPTDCFGGCSKLERVCSPVLALDDCKPFFKAALLGFTDMMTDRLIKDKKVIAKNLATIRRHKAKLMADAIAYYPLLSIMVENGIVTRSDALPYLNEDVSVEVRATLLSAQDDPSSDAADPFDPFGFSFNSEEDENEKKKLWAFREIPGGGLEITGYKGNDEFVTVPTLIGGKEVKGIAPDAFSPLTKKKGCNTGVLKKIRSVYINDGIEYIGERAFKGCENMFEALLPVTVTRVFEDAFARCPHLADENGLVIVYGKLYACYNQEEAVRVPSSVKAIGNFAFWDNSSLKHLTLPADLDELDENALEFRNDVSIIVPDGSPTQRLLLEEGYDFSQE